MTGSRTKPSFRRLILSVVREVKRECHEGCIVEFRCFGELLELGWDMYWRWSLDYAFLYLGIDTECWPSNSDDRTPIPGLVLCRLSCTLASSAWLFATTGIGCGYSVSFRDNVNGRNNRGRTCRIAERRKLQTKRMEKVSSNERNSEPVSNGTAPRRTNSSTLAILRNPKCPQGVNGIRFLRRRGDTFCSCTSSVQAVSCGTWWYRCNSSHINELSCFGTAMGAILSLLPLSSFSVGAPYKSRYAFSKPITTPTLRSGSSPLRNIRSIQRNKERQFGRGSTYTRIKQYNQDSDYIVNSIFLAI